MNKYVGIKSAKLNNYFCIEITKLDQLVRYYARLGIAFTSQSVAKMASTCNFLSLISG